MPLHGRNFGCPLQLLLNALQQISRLMLNCHVRHIMKGRPGKHTCFPPAEQTPHRSRAVPYDSLCLQLVLLQTCPDSSDISTGKRSALSVASSANTYVRLPSKSTMSHSFCALMYAIEGYPYTEALCLPYSRVLSLSNVKKLDIMLASGLLQG